MAEGFHLDEDNAAARGICQAARERDEHVLQHDPAAPIEACWWCRHPGGLAGVTSPTDPLGFDGSPLPEHDS